MKSRSRYRPIATVLAFTLAAIAANAQYNSNSRKTSSSTSSSSSSSSRSSGSYGSGSSSGSRPSGSNSSTSSRRSNSGGSTARSTGGGTTYSRPSPEAGSAATNDSQSRPASSSPSRETAAASSPAQVNHQQAQENKQAAQQAQEQQKQQQKAAEKAAKDTEKAQKAAEKQRKEAEKQAAKEAKEAAHNKPVTASAQPIANAGASAGLRTAGPGSASVATPSTGRASLAYTPPSASAVKKTQGDEMLLNKDGGESVVQQVNASRQQMSGINAKPIPAGKASLQSSGAVRVEASGGKQYTLRPDGTLASYAAKDQKASFHANGTLSMLHSGNLLVNRSANGARRIELVRPDNSVLVSTRPGRGYLQRTVTRNNTSYAQRTYAANNVTYPRTYTTYVYRNVVLDHYVPRVYYAPGFYSWVYHPWAAPARFYWGFYGAPWYAYYGPYFTPYPAYAGPSLWLTDYVLANTLESAYAERDAALAQNSEEGDAPISAEVKEAIAEEVQQQIAAENAASNDPQQVTTAYDLPDDLKQARSTFVVSSALDVSSGDGECELTAGDVIQTNGAQAPDVPTLNVRVVSAKRMDCRAGSLVTVSLNDLQDMENNLREQVDEGLAALRTIQGTNGLPEAPPGVIAPPPVLIAAAAVPDNTEDVAGLLRQEADQADQAEAQLLRNAFGGEVSAMAD